VAWFRVSKGRLEYSGRISRGAYRQWTATKEGSAAIARTASGIRFSLLGRTRAARSRIWRVLEAPSRAELVAAAIHVEADRYMAVIASLAYSPQLPRAHVALRRLVLVPRAMIAGRARSALYERLRQTTEVRGLDEDVQIFFLEQILKEMDAALQAASPSPAKPVDVADGWACVGADTGLVWVDPLWSGPEWTGHVFVYELPPAGLNRRDRKALERAAADMRHSIGLLSRNQRIETVRAAGAGV
jgi:hypothetical protein